MKISISFDGFSPFGDALAFAKEAAGAGVAGIWMADHLGYREPIVSCLSFLLNTADVRVVPTAVSTVQVTPFSQVATPAFQIT